VDDATLYGSSSKVMDCIITSLKDRSDITADEGEIDDYLGVNVTQPTSVSVIM
jgi:hypothetical protein